MIHRESGVFKTSYVSDMAVFPLPIARWTATPLYMMEFRNPDTVPRLALPLRVSVELPRVEIPEDLFGPP